MQALTAEPPLATPQTSPVEVPELSCQDLAKSFGGVPVLENVSFDFLKGTVNILAGENGAGKSTILKIVSGQYHPDKGVVRVAGEPVTNFDPRHARRLGIGIVPQELAPVLDMPVYQNLFLGRELHTRTGLLDHREMIAQSRDMLGVFGIDIDPRIWMRRLSVAVTQLVEIVKTTTWGARILLLDEPTSAIPEGEADVLFEVIRKLKERCVVVYTTHRIAEMTAIGDRVVVLRDGRLTYDRTIGEVTEADIVRAMIGRSLTQLFPPKKLTEPTAERGPRGPRPERGAPSVREPEHPARRDPGHRRAPRRRAQRAPGGHLRCPAQHGRGPRGRHGSCVAGTRSARSTRAWPW